MDHIMNPSLTLLNAEVPPLILRHQMGFRDQFGYVLGQHDMKGLFVSYGLVTLLGIVLRVICSRKLLLDPLTGLCALFYIFFYSPCLSIVNTHHLSLIHI